MDALYSAGRVTLNAEGKRKLPQTVDSMLRTVSLTCRVPIVRGDARYEWSGIDLTGIPFHESHPRNPTHRHAADGKQQPLGGVVTFGVHRAVLLDQLNVAKHGA